MICTNCGKELRIPARAFLNLETYRVGGSILVASECCNTGYTLQMNVSYSTEKYTGDKKEDAWGVEFKTN